MAALPTRKRFTVAEYYQMGEAGILGPDDRTELIEGEIILMSPIGSPHASCVNRYNRLLAPVADDRMLVVVQNPLRLDDRSEPVPDLMLVRPRRDGYAAAHPAPADVLLVIEVSDTTRTYDLGTKVPLYARKRVPEVWVTDLHDELIRVHREPTSDGYAVTSVRRRGESVAPQAFPDLELSVDDILG